MRNVFFALFMLPACLCLSIPLHADDIANGCWENDLMNDLMTVNSVNQSFCDRVPVYYNHLLQGGYFNMPSARMGCEGEVGAGYSYVPPYSNYNLRFQFMDRLEISGSYRVFRGVDDPLLSPFGFGDMSDKGANIKLSLLSPEDSDYLLPGIAVGWEDFIGTKSFQALYIVATQVFPNYNVEMSLGYGNQRIRDVFGGIMWVPFRKSGNRYLKDLSFAAEYDAIPYRSKKREPHPDGRIKKSPINFGMKYRLCDLFDFSLSKVRGEKLAFSASMRYNLGTTTGLLPKIHEPLPYHAPINTEPLGPLRPTDVLVQDLLYPLREQGFDLLEAWLSSDHYGSKILRLEIINYTYRYECDVRYRLTDLIASLIPSDITQVIVVMEGVGFPVQEYRFPMEFVHGYREHQICPYELRILSPLCEAASPPLCHSQKLFKVKKRWWNLDIAPKTYTIFGSAKGKFKYALGIHLGINGYVWNDWYYTLLLGYNAMSNLYDIKDVDKLNPSQLINVRTDIVNYFKQDGITFDEAYIQKNWNLGRGWYARFATGLFEEEYGGAASEFLYYPVWSNLAFGIEGAYLRKRTFSGIGFTGKIRKLVGYTPTYVKFRGSQYFLNAYCHFPDLDIDLHLKGGKFLANDWGIRTELSRTYSSGMRVFFWYTYTNGKDFVNGHRYHDKGIGISLPLDIFFTHSSRQQWCYGMSAWLRDVGAISETGDYLYYIIRDNREGLCH
ncbi:MAG: YjbH domain-containing protein [Waddliaceae bacterium]